MITCILLTGGESKRFGFAKALATVDGKQKIIAFLQEKLIASKVDHVIVVTGADHEKIESHLLNHKKVSCVYNKDHKMGQTSSFQAGLRVLNPETSGIMLLPVDYPLVTTETFNKLSDVFLESKPGELVPTFKGKKGHPPVFNISAREYFLNMNLKMGINSYAHQHPTECVEYPVSDRGVIQTFNTLEEFQVLMQSLK